MLIKVEDRRHCFASKISIFVTMTDSINILLRALRAKTILFKVEETIDVFFFV